MGDNRRKAQKIIRATLAADYACSEDAFVNEDVIVTDAEQRAPGRSLPPSSKPLRVATMGTGVVINCHPERIAWATTTLTQLKPKIIFYPVTIARIQAYISPDQQDLFGPAMYWACSPDSFRPAKGLLRNKFDI